MKSGIYKIVNILNGKFYVGSSKNIEVRWGKHLQKLRSNKHPNIHLQRSYNKDSSAFIIEVIELCNVDDLIAREQYWIDTLNPHYNICKIAGNSIGVKRSEGTKQKLRDINTGKKQSKETVEKRTAKIRGMKRSPEQVEKIRESKMGSKNPCFKNGWEKQITAMTKANLGSKRDKSVGLKIAESNSKPILQYDLKGNFIKEWPSATEVERVLGFSNSHINSVCSGVLCKNKTRKGEVVYYPRKQANGFIWKFKDNL